MLKIYNEEFTFIYHVAVGGDVIEGIKAIYISTGYYLILYVILSEDMSCYQRIIQSGRGLRRFLIKPITPSRFSYDIRSGYAGLTQSNPENP